VSAEQFVVRLLVAALAGMAVGFEREWREKAAGLRTLTLVSAGSALFVLAALGTMPDEVVRMMAGVTAGIGFLGAGAILRHEGEVFGLTTAASVWMSAAVGITAALGLFQATLVAVVLTILVLLAVSLVPIDRIQRETRTYTLTWAKGTPFEQLGSAQEFEERGATARLWSLEDDDSSHVVTWLVAATHRAHGAIAEDLFARKDIKGFTWRG